jgi:hypothetical protein
MLHCQPGTTKYTTAAVQCPLLVTVGQPSPSGQLTEQTPRLTGDLTRPGETSSWQLGITVARLAQCRGVCRSNPVTRLDTPGVLAAELKLGSPARGGTPSRFAGRVESR